MIVKLLIDYTYRGVKFKKGDTITAPRAVAIELCKDEIGVTNEDIPCDDRQKEAAVKRTKKKTKSKL